jgi:hypothetical protein
MAFSQSQDLTIVSRSTEIFLGDGIEIEINLKWDSVGFDNNMMDSFSETSLKGKLIFIPKEIGSHSIGPIYIGSMISNVIVIKVLPINDMKTTYLKSMDSCMVNGELELILSNKMSKNVSSIKDYNLKESQEYDIIGKSYSLIVSVVGDEEMKSEKIIFIIRPRNIGTPDERSVKKK